MRSLRLAVTVLALTLVAAACGNDDGADGDDAGSDQTPTTSLAVATTTQQPPLTTPTTQPVQPPPDVDAPVTPTTSSTTSLPPAVSVTPPVAPANLACLGGSADNELLVEFDALPNPSEVSKIRTYLQVVGEAVITNGEFRVGEIDTARSGGSRWAAPVRDVPALTNVKLYVTSFNQLGQESGWYGVEGVYSAAGAPCGQHSQPGTTTLPPPVCTAGCDEEDGEQAS